MADTPYDPEHERFGEWCSVHNEEFQNHDCELVDGPLRLTAGDWYLSSQGPVATFAGIPGVDPRPLVNLEVEIDGRVYTVRGVETFAIRDASGKPFGLLVEEKA